MDKDDLFHAVKAIVAVQRDYGRRDNRKQARLKYLIDEWGVERFRWGGAAGRQGASGTDCRRGSRATPASEGEKDLARCA